MLETVASFTSLKSIFNDDHVEKNRVCQATDKGLVVWHHLLQGNVTRMISHLMLWTHKNVKPYKGKIDAVSMER